MRRLSTRIGGHWLVLTHLDECKWHLQVWGATPLEAEVTADDETDAKNTAIAATIERLRILRSCRVPRWNAVVTRRWDSRGPGTTDQGSPG
jgi:hypothetical protein